MQKKILFLFLLLGSITSNIEAQTIQSFVKEFNTNLQVQFPNSRSTSEGSVVILHISTKDIAKLNNMTSSKDIDDLISNEQSKNKFSQTFLNSFVSSMGDIKAIRAMGISAFKIYFIKANSDEIYGGMTKL